MMTPLLSGLVVVLAIGLVAVIWLRRGGEGAAASLAPALQSLLQLVHEGHSQNAVLAERLARIEAVAPAVQGLQVEMRGISERLGTVERGQAQLGQGLHSVGSGLNQAGLLTQNLVESAALMRGELSRTSENLVQLQTLAISRHQLEQRTAESIQRLEAVIAGTHSKGAAGESILEEVFARLPAEWQVRNFRVNDKPCEFGLLLPNNLILPIDSKWPATHLIEQFAASDDQAQKLKLREQIEATVLQKAREVRKYLDPHITLDFGVAAVPDAVYDLCHGTLCDAFRLNVALISYSMFVPYLLLVFQTILKHSQTLDVQRLQREVASLETGVRLLQEEVEGRHARALTMLDNSRNEMRLQLGNLHGRLAGLRGHLPQEAILDEDHSAGVEPTREWSPAKPLEG